MMGSSVSTSLERGDRSTFAGRLVLLNSLLYHPAVQISTNLNYHTILIEAHAPGIGVVELQAWYDSVSHLGKCLFGKEKAAIPLLHSATATSSTVAHA